MRDKVWWCAEKKGCEYSIAMLSYHRAIVENTQFIPFKYLIIPYQPKSRWNGDWFKGKLEGNTDKHDAKIHGTSAEHPWKSLQSFPRKPTTLTRWNGDSIISRVLQEDLAIFRTGTWVIAVHEEMLDDYGVLDFLDIYCGPPKWTGLFGLSTLPPKDIISKQLWKRHCYPRLGTPHEWWTIQVSLKGESYRIFCSL